MSKDTKGAAGSAVPGAMTHEEAVPVNGSTLQPSTEELVEARERADAGLRLVFPQLFDRPAPKDDDYAASETEGLMASLQEEIDEAAMTLGKLMERLDLPKRSLAAAVFNRFGVDFVELREQLPTLREAVRERGERS